MRGSRSCFRSVSTPSTCNDGTVRFLAPGISTRDAITARHVNGSISNLTNVLESGKETFADFRVTADVLDGAPAVVAGSVNAFAAQPTFDVNLEVKKVQLPQVNPWLREYIKADAEAGKFELYMELAAADGKFKGYAKPILQDVDIYRSGEAEQSALKRVWEGFLDFAANVLENQDADQVAARIPFTGTIKDPETSLFATIASVMRNAFVSAFARSLGGLDHAARREEESQRAGSERDARTGYEDKGEARSQHGAENETGTARQELSLPLEYRRTNVQFRDSPRSSIFVADLTISGEKVEGLCASTPRTWPFSHWRLVSRLSSRPSCLVSRLSWRQSELLFWSAALQAVFSTRACCFASCFTSLPAWRSFDCSVVKAAPEKASKPTPTSTPADRLRSPSFELFTSMLLSSFE